MTRPPVHLDPLTSHSFQAHQDGEDVFVVRETTQGWKTEGHAAFDGLLMPTRGALLARIEGRDQ